MKKIKQTSLALLFILLFTVTSVLFISQVAACKETHENHHSHKPIKIKAQWKESNGEKFLDLQAPDYFMMGVLEGAYLADKIVYMKLLFQAQAVALGMDYEQNFLPLALSYDQFVPTSYKSEMIGIAAAINDINGDGIDNITYEDVLMQNCMWDGLYGVLTPLLSGYAQPPIIAGGCSVIAVAGEHGNIFGQNIDITQMMLPTASWVRTQIGNGPKVFSFRLGAQLCLGGINNKGIALTVNLVENLCVAVPTIPITIKYRQALETAKTNIEASTIVTTTNPGVGWQTMTISKTEIESIEAIPNVYSQKSISEGYTFDANIYENPLFQMFMIPPNENEIFRNWRIPIACNEALIDMQFTFEELLNILAENNITKKPQSADSWEVVTAAFFAFDYETTTGIFGLGNMQDAVQGIMPI